MSQLRYDITTNDWVIFAPERARRPRDVAGIGRAPEAKEPERCPFCPGNEDISHEEILRVPDPDRPSAWSLRVVENKYPSLHDGGAPVLTEEGRHFQKMAGYGAHEVIVESPDHTLFLGHQPLRQVERLLATLQERYRELMLDEKLRAAIVFKNHGPGAGTSLRHPHWQIIATPVMPRLLRLQHSIAVDYFDRNFKCLHCVLMAEEQAAGTRVLAQTAHFVAVLPYASHLPYQIRVLPRAHQASFAQASQDQLHDLARLLRNVLHRLHAALGDPDFNLTVVSAPRGQEEEGYFLWHIDILPRLSTPAGFEMGSGMAVNSVLPEEAAEILRRAKAPENAAP
jgi:UDPglucose--hexose-1-phosphate uridylyltransferase